MARKKTSPFEEMIVVVSKMPWWAGIALAIVSYLVLHAFATRPPLAIAEPGRMGDAMVRSFTTMLATFGQYILPFGFGLGALISAINARRQKKLYQTVISRPGVAALNEMNWGDFERLISEYYRRNGFQVTRQGGNGPDGGVDLVLRQKDETYLVQCKQWKAYKVGVQPVREFYGVMSSRAVAGGYFVTSGKFTDEALKFAQGINLELIDGRKLRRMIDLSQEAVPTHTSVDSGMPAVVQGAPSCPKCGADMMKRVARKGANSGNEFWGCATFPKCNGTRSLDDCSSAPMPAVTADN